jgi:hypothetical protein
VTVSDQEKPTPALYDHALRVYDQMLRESSVEKNDSIIETSDGMPPEVTIYTGHLTRLFAALEIANPYYTKIKDALVALNCIVQVRRGGGVATSKWVLLKAPTEELFSEYVERKRAPQTKHYQLEQRVKDLTHGFNDVLDRIEKLEARK